MGSRLGVYCPKFDFFKSFFNAPHGLFPVQLLTGTDIVGSWKGDGAELEDGEFSLILPPK